MVPWHGRKAIEHNWRVLDSWAGRSRKQAGRFSPRAAIRSSASSFNIVPRMMEVSTRPNGARHLAIGRDDP
jgi:hypothetical protein